MGRSRASTTCQRRALRNPLPRHQPGPRPDRPARLADGDGYFGVTINTGEDNYLRTADAIEAAPSVTASQFINRQLALDSGVPDQRIALGDAFEIDHRCSTVCCSSGRKRS